MNSFLGKFPEEFDDTYDDEEDGPMFFPLSSSSFLECDGCFTRKYVEEICLACGHDPSCRESHCCHNYEKIDLQTTEHSLSCEICVDCQCEELSVENLCLECAHTRQCQRRRCESHFHCECHSSSLGKQICLDCGHRVFCTIPIGECANRVHCLCDSELEWRCNKCSHTHRCEKALEYCDSSIHNEEELDFIVSWVPKKEA